MDVVIALDSYDDIFDDFDIRNYSQRGISYDFLEELKRRVKNAKGIRLILLVPKNKRSRRVEKIIIKRLRGFFKERAAYWERKANQTLKRGLAYITIGILLLLLIGWLEGSLGGRWEYLITNFLFVPSWFFVWGGLDKIVEGYPKQREGFLFYSLLSKSKIRFDEEEKYED